MWILEWIEQLFEAKAKTHINRVLELPSLHQAAQEGNMTELMLCLYHKANVNEQAIKNGRTALHYAAETGNEEMVKILLQHRADITVEDKEGNTARKLAKTVGKIKIQMLLVDVREETKLLQKAVVTENLKDFITSDNNDVCKMGEVKIIENDTE